jgi:hypothetical protein
VSNLDPATHSDNLCWCGSPRSAHEIAIDHDYRSDRPVWVVLKGGTSLDPAIPIYREIETLEAALGQSMAPRLRQEIVKLLLEARIQAGLV